MAFLPGTDEEEDQPAAFDDEQPLAPAPGAGAGAGGPGGAVPTALPEAGAQQQTAGEGFTDTGSYLSANRPQAEKLGEFIGGKLTEEREGLAGDISSSFDPYQSDIEAARTPEGGELIERAAQDPTSFLSSPEDVAAFQQQRTAQYGGPGELGAQDFYGQLSGRIEDVEKRPGQVESEKGRESLLFETTESPTAGKVALDQLLLGGSPEARERLSASVGPTPELRQDFESRAGAATEARGSAVESAERARKAVQDRFYGEGGVGPTFKTGLEDRLSQERTSQTEQSKAAIADLLDKGALDPVNAAYLGISREGHESFLENLEALQRDYQSPLDVDQYLQQYTAEGKIPGIESMATQEDLAKQQALQQLLGEDYMGPLNEGLVNQEGGMMPDFRLAEFDEANANRQAELALMGADQSLADVGVVGVPYQEGVGFTDQAKADQYYNMLMRNPGFVDPDKTSSGPGGLNRNFINLYEQQFGPGDVTPPDDSFDYGPTDASPWEPGQERLRVIEGPEGAKQNWWDGNEWVTPPAETVWLDAEGNRVGPEEAQITQQFDYNTGQYTTIWQKPPDDTGGGSPPGVIRAS